MGDGGMGDVGMWGCGDGGWGRSWNIGKGVEGKGGSCDSGGILGFRERWGRERGSVGGGGGVIVGEYGYGERGGRGRGMWMRGMI